MSITEPGTGMPDKLESDKSLINEALRTLLFAATLRIIGAVGSVVILVVALAIATFAMLDARLVEVPWVVPIGGVLAATLGATLVNFYLRHQIEYRSMQFVALSTNYFRSQFYGIIEGCHRLEQLSQRLFDKGDNQALEEVRQLSLQTLKKWEDYRETFDGIMTNAEKYIESYRASFISSFSGFTITAAATTFITFQIFDLLLSLLQYSRYGKDGNESYKNSEFFSNIDTFVINNLFDFLTGATLIFVVGAAIVVTVLLIGQISVSQSLRTVTRARNMVETGTPPNEEIRQAVSQLIGSLIRQNYELGRRYRSNA